MDDRVIIVTPPEQPTIAVIGIAGPKGDPGTASTGAFVHTQLIPATVWTVEHDLGFNPAGITVVDTDNYQLDDFGVEYLIDGQTLRLTFDIAVSGAAYLS